MGTVASKSTRSKDSQSVQPLEISDHSFASTRNDILTTLFSLSIDLLIIYGCYRLSDGLVSSFMEVAGTSKRSKQAESRLREQMDGSPLQLTAFEKIIAAEVVDPRNLSVSFADIGGLDFQKQEIQESFILPLRRPDLFQHRALSLPTGLLLYGKPGTGKTLLAKAIAKESGAFFINLRMSTMTSKWQGESEKLIEATFSLAKKLSPCIIFMDEVDSFMGNRTMQHNENMNSLKTEFMVHWDGFLSSQAHESTTTLDLDTEAQASPQNRTRKAQIVVIGATNRPNHIDPAFLRRMPLTFEVGMPNADQRLAILKVHLSQENLSSDFNLAEIAQNTTGYSGSDLKELCRVACMRPIREFARRQTSRGSSRRTIDNPESQAPDTEDSIRALKHSDFTEARETVLPTGASAQNYEQAQAQSTSEMPSSHSSAPPQMDVSLMTAMLTGIQIGLSAKSVHQS